MQCNRCQASMELVRKKKPTTFLDQISGMVEDRFSRLIYTCPACGAIKPVMQGTLPKWEGSSDLSSQIKISTQKHSSLIDSIKLSQIEKSSPTDIDDILKLIPGQSMLEFVYEKIGQPFAVHELELGIALCFHSAEKRFPHVVLIDPIYRLVKMVAIHNDHQTFPLEKLENVYGARELAAQFDWREHWLFDELGVGYITEERVDQDILYLQYFETRIGFNRYLELEGFSDAVFVCSDDK